MKIIVTGVAGFIGSHLAERLLIDGHHVVGIDNLSRPGSNANLDFLKNMNGEFGFEHADIRCQSDIERVFRKNCDCSAVFHEAAQVAVTTSVLRPREDFETNALGTLNILEAVREHAGSASVVFASTNKVYGNLEDAAVREDVSRYVYRSNEFGIGEDTALDFHSPYGCSKGAADQYVRDYARIYGMKTTVLRQSCIYGTRQFGMEDQGWVAWMCICAALNRQISVFGNGKQVRDLLWIEDLVDLYVKILHGANKSDGQIYNAGGGYRNSLSIVELLSLLETRLGRRIDTETFDWRPGDQKIFIANCTRAETQLGWRPTTSPSAGVERLMEWIEGNRKLLLEIVGGCKK